MALGEIGQNKNIQIDSMALYRKAEESVAIAGASLRELTDKIDRLERMVQESSIHSIPAPQKGPSLCEKFTTNLSLVFERATIKINRFFLSSLDPYLIGAGDISGICP